jgi:hypothetical protein
MGGSKGKARKRREANYSAAHPGITPQLAPPPSAKDIVAIPSKLRRIMSLKAPSAPGKAFLLNPRPLETLGELEVVHCGCHLVGWVVQDLLRIMSPLAWLLQIPHAKSHTTKP